MKVIIKTKVLLPLMKVIIKTKGEENLGLDNNLH
jgi:hypothetical protein